MKSLIPKEATSTCITSEKKEIVYQILSGIYGKMILEGAFFHNCYQNLGKSFWGKDR